MLRMNISLIIKLTIMKTVIHRAETHREGSMSQNIDIGLRFCFILCRKMDFQKNSIFALKIKLGPK